MLLLSITTSISDELQVFYLEQVLLHLAGTPRIERDPADKREIPTFEFLCRRTVRHRTHLGCDIAEHATRFE
jgi:hypothetical protein